MKMKHIVRPLEIKALSEDGSFEGYGSVFHVIDSYHDVVLPGAFAQSIQEHKDRGDMPAMLWQHKSDHPIGVWTDMSEDERGLKMSGQLILDTQLGRETHALLKAGAVKGLSIGYSMYPGGEKYNDAHGIWELSNIQLWETSIVTFPANTEAQITDVRAALDKGTYPTIREFERMLRDAGFSRKDSELISGKGFSALAGDSDADMIEAIKSNISKLQG